MVPIEVERRLVSHLRDSRGHEAQHPPVLDLQKAGCVFLEALITGVARVQYQLLPIVRPTPTTVLLRSSFAQPVCVSSRMGLYLQRHLSMSAHAALGGAPGLHRGSVWSGWVVCAGCEEATSLGW